MNSALLKRLGIKETQVIQPTKAVRGRKETTDSNHVKDVRQNGFQEGPIAYQSIVLNVIRLIGIR